MATLDRETAEKCLEVVKRHLGEEADPKLYEPGHEGNMWVVSLEGWEDWAVTILDAQVPWPEGVFVEPVADWCLGLYPA